MTVLARASSNLAVNPSVSQERMYIHNITKTKNQRLYSCRWKFIDSEERIASILRVEE
jgi:hypothetical protein